MLTNSTSLLFRFVSWCISFFSVMYGRVHLEYWDKCEKYEFRINYIISTPSHPDGIVQNSWKISSCQYLPNLCLISSANSVEMASKPGCLSSPVCACAGVCVCVCACSSSCTCDCTWKLGAGLPASHLPCALVSTCRCETRDISPRRILIGRTQCDAFAYFI